MPTASKVDSLILEILTFCRIVGVKPSVIRDNFVRVDNDGEVFHPFDINYINRTVARNLNDSYNSYRRTPNGGKSKYRPLKRGWTIEGKIRLKRGATIFLPKFTEKHFLSQFYSTNTDEEETSIIATTTSANRTMTNAWSMPDSLSMNVDVDGITVNYHITTSLDSKGRVLLGQPWNIVVAYMDKRFIKDGKSKDGLLIFHKAQNSLDLDRNAVDVATVGSTKKGVFLVQVNGMKPGVFDEIMGEISNEPEYFGSSVASINTTLRALKQKVSVANKVADIVTYYVHFEGLPYALEPGSFQMPETTEINDQGLTSRLVEVFEEEGSTPLDLNRGFLIVAGIADEEGQDDLTDDETENPRDKARRIAKEKRIRKSGGRRAADADVESVAAGISSISFASPAPTGTGQTQPNSNFATEAPPMSPSTRQKELFYSKLHQLFMSTTPVGEDNISLMRAVAVSCQWEWDIASELYNRVMQHLFGNSKRFSEEFELGLSDFTSEEAYYAQIQALAETEGLCIQLYELEDFDSSNRASPLPFRQYEPENSDDVQGLAYVLRDGPCHHALHPHPTKDPTSDDSDEDSVPDLITPLPTNVNVPKQSSSLEKMMGFIGLSSAKKSAAEGSAYQSPAPSSNSVKGTSKQKSWSNPRHLSGAFDVEAMSTASTVQTSGSKKNPPPPEKKRRNMSIQASTPPPPPLRRSTRNQNKKNKGGRVGSNK